MQANFAHCYTTQGKNVSSSVRIQLLITKALDEGSWGDLGPTTPIPHKEMDWSEVIGNRKLMPTRTEARISQEINEERKKLFSATDNEEQDDDNNNVDDVMNPASWDFAETA